jgi:hypothetical protein
MNALLIVIKAIGLIMAVMGVAIIAIPGKAAKVVPFFKHGKRIYWVGICRLICATIFLLAASQCRWPAVIAIIGIIALVSGVLIFALKLKVLRSILDWFPGQSAKVLRIIGGVVVIIGLLIIFAV